MTLVLQLIPYSIAGGVGVYVGVDAWRALRTPRRDIWLGFSKGRLRDVALAYDHGHTAPITTARRPHRAQETPNGSIEDGLTTLCGALE